MNKVVLLAATFVLSSGVMLGQSSPTAGDTGRPTAAPDQMQPSTQPAPKIKDHSTTNPTANPDRTGATPATALPSTSVDDQQPGNSTTGSSSSTMGTTGSTPGTDQSTTGNKSGTTPNNTQTPDDNSARPHDKCPSGSSNPSSSANGASSNDMSGTNPRPDSTTTNSPNPQSTPPHIATHVPDPGTETNPASLELPVAAKIRN